MELLRLSRAVLSCIFEYLSDAFIGTGDDNLAWGVDIAYVHRSLFGIGLIDQLRYFCLAQSNDGSKAIPTRIKLYHHFRPLPNKANCIGKTDDTAQNCGGNAPYRQPCCCFWLDPFFNEGAATRAPATQ